jgi:hypothetical protein
MDKNRSRVAQEAKDAERRADEVEKKIHKLSEQIADPERHFSRKDDRTQSAVERFRRYFTVDRSIHLKRKPTRSEMRAQRTRAIVWVLIAGFLLIFVSGKLIKILLH